MTAIEMQIKSILPGLNKAEKNVAVYFLNNIENVFCMSIAELSLHSNSSQVSWVRFCKTLGYSGLKEFKRELFAQLQSAPSEKHDKSLIFSDVKDFTSTKEISDTICNNAIMSLTSTFKILDLKAADKAIFALSRAVSIKLFGVSASGLVAEDFCNKLLRIGANASYCKDLHMQYTCTANLTPKDMAIIITNSGQTKEIVRIFDKAKERACPVLVITSFQKTRLSQEADFVFFTSSNEFDKRSGATSSRIAQLAVVDFLFTLLANKNYTNIHNRLERSYNIMQSESES